MRIPLPFLAHSRVRSDLHRDGESLAQDVIALCVDAVLYAHGDEDGWLQQRYGMNRLDIFDALFQGLSYWYQHQPQDFQPIVESYTKDGVQSVTDFPTIIYTSGTALLANQLYSTAMLLLLQNKPRFTGRRESTSSSMSIVWHAHRICGIAMQNESKATWDPCLVASSMVAARTVTHQSQHAAIITTLERVQSLTGYTFNADRLRHEWDMADGW